MSQQNNPKSIRDQMMKDVIEECEKEMRERGYEQSESKVIRVRQHELSGQYYFGQLFTLYNVLRPGEGCLTALVSKKLGRDYIGIELNANYIKLANNRLKRELGLFH